MKDGGPISLSTGAVTSSKELDRIIVKGAKEHNLKDIDIDIPKKKMVVFTGVSGSGKSSLAFDTIFAGPKTPKPLDFEKFGLIK